MATAQSPSAFLAFVDKTILKTANFQNALRVYDCQARTTKLCEMIALFLLIPKNSFYCGG